MRNEIIQFAVLAISALFPAQRAEAQGAVTYDYTGSSDLKNNDGEKVGSGSMSHLSVKLPYTFYIKANNGSIPTTWGITANADYASLDNDRGARAYNPDEIINAGLTLSHTRPLSGRWGLIAAAGCGIYAEPDHVRWQSLLANVMAVAAYRVNESLSVGGGAGLTNSFGPPTILPMVYLDWRLKGKYDVNVSFVGRLNVTGSMWVSPTWKLSLTPIEMDGMSAVMKIDGRNKIYSMTMMKSAFTARYYLAKRLSAFVSAGCMYSRVTKISNRKFSEMYKNLFSSSGKMHYAPAFRFAVGFSYGI